MIEKILLKHLNDSLDVPCYMEKPEPSPDKFVRIEKTGSSNSNYIDTVTLAVQSYASSLLDAATLNEDVKIALREFLKSNQVAAVNILSDYNFTDTTKKKYRYQAVVNITYYDERR